MTESHFRIAFLDDWDLTDGEEYNRDGHGEDQSAVKLNGHGTSSEFETLAQTCLDCINCNVLASLEHVIAFHHRKTLLGEWTSRQFFPSQLNQRGVFSQLVTEDNNNVLPFLLNWKHISSDESAKPKEEGGSVFWISTYFNREGAHQAKSQEYEFGIRLLKDENDADNGPKVVAKLFKCLSHGEDIKVEGSRKQGFCIDRNTVKELTSKGGVLHCKIMIKKSGKDE